MAIADGSHVGSMRFGKECRVYMCFFKKSVTALA